MRAHVSAVMRGASLASVLVTLSVLSALSAQQDPPLRCQHPRCYYSGVDYDGEYSAYSYKVDDHQMTIGLEVDQLNLNCDGVSLLESRAFPHAVPALRVARVSVMRCPLSAARSLADTLAAVHVTLTDGHLKLVNLAQQPQLTANYFAGLESLVRLEIAGNIYDLPRPARGFLGPLASLRTLEIWHAGLPVGELDSLPSLRKLRLEYVEGVEWLPAITTLELLKMSAWSAPKPKMGARCDSLRELRLVGLAAGALPAGWLENCSRLELLEITEAHNLTNLPASLLVGTGALRHFIFKEGALQTLPAGLLDHSPELLTLNFFNNRLRALPSGMFAVARRVRELKLFWNDLDSRAVDELAPLDRLVELDLGSNPRLGDVCGTDGYSPIRNSTELKRLILSYTGVRRICRDWRDDLRKLEYLDLSYSNITELSFEELLFTRNVKAEVELTGAPVTVVSVTREQFEEASRGLSTGANVSVRVSAAAVDSLACDCRMYWTRRVLDSSPFAMQVIGEQTCRDGRRLRDVPPEELVCSRPEECAALPAACSCSVRPDDDARHNWLLVRVHCENASLDHVPIPRPPDRSTERLYELLLRYNNITELHANDLRHNIKGLDLRNNSLRSVDEETAATLGALEGSLRIAGNPLECSCAAAPLLRALHARAPALTDLNDAACDDDTALYTAPTADCISLAARLAIVLAVLLVLVIMAAVFLASRERRFFMRAVLHRWGVVWHVAELEGDSGRRYDAFLTFSHQDEDVARQVMERLEPTYRLCIHHRDWIPGLPISSQVVDSVRESRRTVALVSQHFLKSSWTVAEFQEAHAQAMLEARPRLVVVLLEEPAALQMDDQLHRYVNTHTYLRWGEPWFWDKLAVALPRPRNTPPACRDPSPALR